jgi:hypothetical protein
MSTGLIGIGQSKIYNF